METRPQISLVLASLYMNQLAQISKGDEGCKMVDLPRSSKNKNTTVGRFKHDAGCKKHPKHRQSPGVCSLCLKDKLTQLSTSSSRKITSSHSTSSSVSSLSSYYSSSSASSSASPVHRFRFATQGKSSSSISVFLFNAKHGFIRSSSMAVVPRRRDDPDADYKSTKKGGFFFKLLRPRSNKRMEEKDILS